MILEPPQNYNYPYHGQVIEQRLSWEEMDRICGKGNLACMKDTFIINGICVIFLPLVGVGGVSKSTYDALKRHELGHCNGWRHD